MKLIRKIYTVFIIAMLYLPMLTANYKKNVVSVFDNKKLTEMPEIGEEGFNRKLETYLGDRIGFRSAAITMYQYLCDRLFHVLAHPDYLYGSNDKIYSPADMITYQHLDVEKEYVDNITGYIEKMNTYCKDRNTDFLFFLCPNKESVYSEDFPRGYNIKNQKNRSDFIVESLIEKGISYVYPKKIFEDTKKDVLLYNDKYDVLHWNDAGCFLGMAEIIRIERSYGYDVSELKLSEFTISEKKEKYLPQSYFVINDIVPEYTIINDNTKDDSEDFFRNFADVNENEYHVHIINQSIENAPKVLVMGDSYFGRKLVWDCLKSRSSELLMVHVVNMDNIKEYIDEFEPDIVIIEAVERVLGENGYWSTDNIRKWNK